MCKGRCPEGAEGLSFEMSDDRERFKGEKPVAIIRSPAIFIASILMAAISIVEFMCIPLVALRLETGKIGLSIFFAIFGLLCLIISAVGLATRVKIYESGFTEGPFDRTSVLYKDCVSKSPVIAYAMTKGRKEIHHIKIDLSDGTSFDLAQWEMKPVLTERIGLDELPIKEIIDSDLED